MSRYLSFVVFVLLGEVNEAVEDVLLRGQVPRAVVIGLLEAVENVLLRGQVPRAVLVDLLKELVDRAHVPAAVIEQAILDGGISVPVLVSWLILNELVDRARVPAVVIEQAILNGGISVPAQLCL